MFISLKPNLYPLLGLLTLFVLWEFYSRLSKDLFFVLPPPSLVINCIWEKSDRFLHHTFVTLTEMIGGILVAFSAALPLAWMMTHWNTARMILQPIFVIIQCIPMFVLAPMMVFWFEWSYLSIVIPTALMIFFPLTMNLYQGLKSIPLHFTEYFRINGATSWQMFYKLQLPWAKPYFFAGLRISTAIAGIGAIAGEWAGAQEGLGPVMIESRRAADLEMMFGAFFCLAFVSMAFYTFAVLLEKKMTRPKNISNKIIPSLLLMSFLLSCQTQDSSKQSTRLLLDWMPNPNHVPLYVGIEKGFFQERGIYLQLIKIHDPSDSIPFLTSGQVDLSLTYTIDIIRAKNRGAPIEPVAVLIEKPLNSIIYRSGQNIEKPSDLSGKVIGYCVDGTQTHYLKTVLSLNGINPKAIKNVSFDLVSALGTEKVDAIFNVCWNIECEHLRSLGIETDYFRIDELGVPYHEELIIVAKANTLHVSEKFVSQFRQALQKSIQYSLLFPEEAFSYYLKANPDKRDKTAAWERIAWFKTLSSLSTKETLNLNQWDKFSQWLESNELLINR